MCFFNNTYLASHYLLALLRVSGGFFHSMAVQGQAVALITLPKVDKRVDVASQSCQVSINRDKEISIPGCHVNVTIC